MAWKKTRHLSFVFEMRCVMFGACVRACVRACVCVCERITAPPKLGYASYKTA